MPRSETHIVARCPHRGLRAVLVALVCACVGLLPTSVTAQPKPKEPTLKKDDGNGGRPGKPKVFDFTGLDISGRLRTPQLLYFLERANEELERASLEKRSFIPEMVKSIDEEAL